MSPSSRRAWIEIPQSCNSSRSHWSPSSRRAWIEIAGVRHHHRPSRSPSSRRAWIEIRDRRAPCCRRRVALLAEGVDRNILGVPEGLLVLKSPSSRRVWIEISRCRSVPSTLCVALLAEGVDRNRHIPGTIPIDNVALLAEGVDRNTFKDSIHSAVYASPSSRRAWIEIKLSELTMGFIPVALLAEGVDRNVFSASVCVRIPRRPPHGGRG